MPKNMQQQAFPREIRTVTARVDSIEPKTTVALLHITTNDSLSNPDAPKLLKIYKRQLQFVQSRMGIYINGEMWVFSVDQDDYIHAFQFGRHGTRHELR